MYCTGLPTNPSPPTSAALTARSVPQSVPSANLFQEYPNPIYSNPKPIDRNPVTREAPNYFTRERSIVRFGSGAPNNQPIVYPNNNQPNNNQPRGQPNGYGGTSGQPNGYGGTSGQIQPIISPPISNPSVPISGSNNSFNERAFEDLGLNRECLDCICQVLHQI